MEKLLVIDGNSIINRAFYGTQNSFMKNAEGLPTGALFGFLTIYFKHFDSLKPTHVAVAFDMKAPTFRHKMYTAYKGTRKPMPEELAAQMPVLKELLDAMNVYRIGLEGFEADDIIGTLAKRFVAEKGADNAEAVILTGDRDSLQLVGGGVTVMLAGNKSDTLFDAAGVADYYGGLGPEKLIDLKALQGDSSDNIPGVPGVGPKTATDLLIEYGSLDGVYSHIDDIPKAGLRQKLADNKSLAYLSKELGRIDIAVPVDLGSLGIDALRVRECDNAALGSLLAKLEFRHWAQRFSAKGAHSPDNASPLNDALSRSDAPSLFDFADSEKDNIAPSAPDSVPYTDFCKYVSENGPGFICIYYSGTGSFAGSGDDFSFSVFTSDLLCFSAVSLKGNEPFPPELSSLLENGGVGKVLFKSKPFMRECFRRGIEFRGLSGDLSLASYLLDSTRSSDDLPMVLRFLSGRGYTSEYEGICDAHRASLAKLEALGMTELYKNVELPLASVLAKMELRGFKVDADVLAGEGREMDERIEYLRGEIFRLAGREFNINSTKQLAVVLFEELGLRCSKKTKSGYSTDSDVLEDIYNDHPIVPLIIEYRQNKKLKSTYIDGLLNVIDRSTSRVHSTFNQNLTATGRLSSSEPNLQNIPVRSELGKLIRKAFVPSDGDHVLIDADYSQIELRVLASMSGDPLMISNFENDFDVHTSTAAVVNRVPVELVTPEMRSRAKAVNFGIVYGISNFGLARDIGVSNYAAKQLIDNYFTHYPGIKRFMDASVRFAKDNGYAATLMGRRRPLPELSPSAKYVTRQFGERVAMNMPVQGTAADIIKLAMINVERALDAGGYRSKLILQVHDELLIDAVRDEAEEVAALLKREMENCFKLKVPLKVSVSESDVSWYYCK